MDQASDVAGLPPAPEVLQVEVGLLQNLCEILWCPETGEGAVVDPAFEVDRLLRESKRLGVRLTQVLVTHTHVDHIEGVGEIVARTGAAVLVHPNETDALLRAVGAEPSRPTVRLVELADRQRIAIGRRGVRALETPGHTAGGTCYLADGYVITGDVLFVGGCGRTDFAGGDPAALWRSLQRLAALPEETRVYPGHDYGPSRTSTVSRELLENPYLRAATYEEFHRLRTRL